MRKINKLLYFVCLALLTGCVGGSGFRDIEDFPDLGNCDAVQTGRIQAASGTEYIVPSQLDNCIYVYRTAYHQEIQNGSRDFKETVTTQGANNFNRLTELQGWLDGRTEKRFCRWHDGGPNGRLTSVRSYDYLCGY